MTIIELAQETNPAREIRGGDSIRSVVLPALAATAAEVLGFQP